MENQPVNPQHAHAAGAILIAAAVTWVIAITIESPFDLQPSGSGALFIFDQALFLLAIAGLVAGLAWLRIGLALYTV